MRHENNLTSLRDFANHFVETANICIVEWGIDLIEKTNPHWDDLAIGLGFERLPDHVTPRVTRPNRI